MSYESLTYQNPKNALWMAMNASVGGLIAREAGLFPSSRRRDETKSQAEYRQACHFAYARACLIEDPTLRFAMNPEVDDSVDSVIRTASGTDAFVYEPVQHKELVPESVSRDQTIEGICAAIRNLYSTTEVLTIAINLNRDAVTSLSSLQNLEMPRKAFWLFGLSGANRGFIVKNPFSHPEVFEYSMPRAPSSRTHWGDVAPHGK